MPTQTFEFEGADGQHMVGQLDLPDGTPRAAALFAHCFTCTRKSLAAVRVSRALAARGIAVLRFDFTGLGDSEGDFSGSGFSSNVRDLVSASMAMARHGTPPTLMIGHSFGGAAALAATAQLPDIRAVATIAAPFDIAHVTKLFGNKLDDIARQGEATVDLGGRPFTIRRAFIDDLSQHDPADAITHLNRPVLVLHSPIDQIVGIENASAIFLAARHPKSFVSLDHADHLLTKADDAAYAADVIAAWASRYLGTAPEDALGPPGDAVTVTETGGGKFQAEVMAAGIRFLADEPVHVGGLGSGPGPYQLVSAGLGACTAMTMRLYADRKQWPLGRVSVTVNHAKDSGTPADLFTREISIAGDLTMDQRARLMEIANKCPVHRTLEAGSRVETHEAAASAARPAAELAAPHFAAMSQTCEEPVSTEATTHER